MFRQLEEDHLFGSCCFPGRKPTMEVFFICYIQSLGYPLGFSI